MLKRCSECGSFWDTTICLKTKEPRCISCCDPDCGSRFSCWGRIY